MSRRGGTGGAAAWTTLSRVVAQGMQFAVFVVAARYLAPADFGIYVLISSINMLLMRFAEAGWREFETSWEGAPAVEAQALGLSLVSSIGISALGALAGWVMIWFPQLSPYASLQVLLSLSLLGTGPYSTWAGYLVRDRRAATLAKVDLVAQTLGGLCSMAGLYYGYRLDALGAGKLATQLLNVLALWPVVRWTAGLRLTGTGGHSIAQFTKSLLGAKLIGYLQGYAATLVISLFLGPAAVGLYRAGSRVVASLAEVIAEPLRIVCWTNLRGAIDRVSAAQPAVTETERGDHPGRMASLAESSERFLTMALVVTTPIYLGLAVTAEPTIVVMLGEQWRGAASVVTILSLSRLVSTPLLLTAPLLSLARRVEKIPTLNLITGLSTVLALPLFAPFGVVPAALGQLAAALVSLWFSARAHTHYGAVRFHRAILDGLPSFAASLAMVAALALARAPVRDWVSAQGVQLALQVALGLLVFLPLFALFGGFRRITSVLARG